MSPLERLHKVLAQAGFGSRRKCEQLIAAGVVQVDGKVVSEMGVKVDPSRQKIKCGDRYVRLPEPETYMLNKPRGIVCTTRDPGGRRTVLDCMSGVGGRLYPAGRLDADSQGLVIMTSDGALCQRLTHARFRVPKTYHVIIRGALPPEIVARVQKGVWLSEGRTGSVRVHVDRRTREATVLEVTLHEGMNREVRRIFARWGYKVKRLKRVRIGNLSLGGLPEGSFRKLDPEEIHRLLRTEARPRVRADRSEEE